MAKKKHFLAKKQKKPSVGDHEDHRISQSAWMFLRRIFRSRRKPKKVEN